MQRVPKCILKTLLSAVMALLISSTAYAGRVENLDLQKPENACPSKNLGEPQTEAATFLGIVEEGDFLVNVRFADGETALLPMGTSPDSLRTLSKNTEVSITYQSMQFWDAEGDGACRSLTKVQEILPLGQSASSPPEASTSPKASAQGGQSPLAKAHATRDPWASLKNAAQQGDPAAQRNLGILYANGERIPQDYTQALHWLTQAAKQEDFAAMNSLGIMYESGMGVAKDEVQAVEWYRKAAYGLSDAVENLHRMWKKGSPATKIKGVPCDALRVEISGSGSRALRNNHSVTLYAPGGTLVADVLLDGQEVAISSRSQWPGVSYTSLSHLNKRPNEVTVIQVGGDVCRFTESFR